MRRENEKRYRRGEETPPDAQEDYFDDYWSEDPYTGGGAHLTPLQREAYYAERDAYYAERDAYYARRDAYYARHEADEDEDGYDYDYEYDDYDDGGRARPARRRRAAAPRKNRRKKKRHVLRRLLALVLFAGVIALLLGVAPVRNPGGLARRTGHSTVLLAGTDADGYRTDTVMLLSLDRAGADARVLSIPRDTYAPGYAVPKLNSAYAAGGMGASGMEELMRRVTEIVGFSPDAYLLIDMDCFVQAVDLLGGVDYDVPVDMQYEDYTQGLVIDLRAGLQHLDGEQVMGLLRYRSGYATADIGRTQVQREFLREALRQWLRPANLRSLPGLWRLYRENALTDLSTRNVLWILRVLVKALPNGLGTDVLPGGPAMVGDASCYVVDAAAAADVLAGYDPYR